MCEDVWYISKYNITKESSSRFLWQGYLEGTWFQSMLGKQVVSLCFRWFPRNIIWIHNQQIQSIAMHIHLVLLVLCIQDHAGSHRCTLKHELVQILPSAIYLHLCIYIFINIFVFTIFVYTTWKVDGTTSMYWSIMAPYKSPPFGSIYIISILMLVTKHQQQGPCSSIFNCNSWELLKTFYRPITYGDITKKYTAPENWRLGTWTWGVFPLKKEISIEHPSFSGSILGFFLGVCATSPQDSFHPNKQHVIVQPNMFHHFCKLPYLQGCFVAMSRQSINCQVFPWFRGQME